MNPGLIASKSLINSSRKHKKTVCIVIPSHWAVRMGGAEYQASLIMRELIARSKHEIYYLTRRLEEGFRPEGYQIIKIADHKGIRRNGFFFDTLKLNTILKKIGPDIIYQRVGCAYTGIAAYYARRNNCKFIWHISSDGDVLPHVRRQRRNIILPYLEKKFLEYGIAHADIIIAQTFKQSNYLQEYYGRESKAVIPNMHPFPEEEIRKNNPIKIVWIGNFKDIKRPEIFVRLAKDFEKFSELEFIMIGSMPNRRRWHDLMEEASQIEGFRYKGSLPQGEVNAILAQAHILVNTSRFEGFPNTFIQAWMRKVPVVSLMVNPDNVLSDYGVGLFSKDYEGLVRDLKRLIEDAVLRNRIAAKAQVHANKNHSDGNMNELMRHFEI